MSAESGVLTYKGNTNTFPIGGKQMTHEEAAVRTVFDAHPLDFWRKQHVFKRSVNDLSPNAVHHAVSRLAAFYNASGKSAFVIT